MSNYAQFFPSETPFNICRRNAYHYAAEEKFVAKGETFALSFVIDALDDVPIKGETLLGAAFECYTSDLRNDG